MESKIKIGIIGITGRMGTLLANKIEKIDYLELIGGFSSKNSHPHYPNLSLNEIFSRADFVIDFSHHDLIPIVLNQALLQPKPLIICTTGWEETSKIQMDLNFLSTKAPLLISSNTSIGANLQLFLAKKIAQIIPPDFDVDIMEKHHRHKLDIPSGTALSLAKGIQESFLKKDIPLRLGIPPQTSGPREKNNLEIHAQRSGMIPGDHEVTFTSDLEQISIKHVAYNRELFASGVLAILKWFLDKKPENGRYTMMDVLGLTNSL